MKKLKIPFIAIALTLLSQLTFAKGWVDVATFNRYAGWACKPGSPQVVAIHIYASGQLIGAGNANLLRETAVKNACKSTSQNHGFDISVNVPAALLNGSNHEVMLYSIYADGSHEKLDNTPIQVNFPALPGQEMPINFGDIVGRDLSYSWAGPLNYFGHIGIWDGAQVIEATGSHNGDDTLKITPWSAYASLPTRWPTISPVTLNIRQSYCDKAFCQLYEQPNGDLTTNAANSGVREMVAKSAYLKYLIGASYTRLATFNSSKQGYRYSTTRLCNPFATSCIPTIIQEKAKRGTYRCETFALEAWASTSTSSGYPLMAQFVSSFQSQRDVDKWGRQTRFLISPARIRTPRDTYDNFKRQWWGS